MIPELRAIADRLILDSANVKYVATNLPKGALERTVAGSTWTVRQVLAHLAAIEGLEAEACARFVRGEPPIPEGFDIEVLNAQTVAAVGRTPLPKLLAALDEGVRRSIAGLEQVTPADASREFRGGATLLETLRRWSTHYARHGVDLAGTLPELRFEPMVLNWLLYADFSGCPHFAGRQQRLLEEVRERFADADAGEEDTDGP